MLESEERKRKREERGKRTIPIDSPLLAEKNHEDGGRRGPHPQIPSTHSLSRRFTATLKEMLLYHFVFIFFSIPMRRLLVKGFQSQSRQVHGWNLVVMWVGEVEEA